MFPLYYIRPQRTGLWQTESHRPLPSALYSTEGISLHPKEPWPHPAQRDSLLHVVLSCIDLLKPGELQPPIGCIAGEARPETLECLLDSFRPVCRFKQKGILSGFGIKSLIISYNQQLKSERQDSSHHADWCSLDTEHNSPEDRFLRWFTRSHGNKSPARPGSHHVGRESCIAMRTG